MHHFETISLPPVAPGTTRHLHVHRFGALGAEPKVYIQAALHADETPAMLVADHLLSRLAKADQHGDIEGEIIIVPFANPLGLSQRMLAGQIGRGDLGGGGNYNRNFPDLSGSTIAQLKALIGQDPAKNDALIRSTLRRAASVFEPHNEQEALRITLLRLAIDAHIVLDLHCHQEGITYLYCNEAGWPAAEDLSAQIASRATLVGPGGGIMAFDEACDEPWNRICAAFGSTVEHGCLAATIEYRGQADVSDELAGADADNLVRFLQRRGVLKGEPGPLPEPLCEATPVDAVDHVRATAPGVLVHKVDLGARVVEGQIVAEIAPMSGDPFAARIPLRARADGLVYGRLLSRLARPGTVYLSIAGKDPSKVRDGLGDPYP
jgi:hypothetical protein